MEITVQSTDSLRIKGKTGSVFINPIDKTASYNAVILLGNPAKASLKIRDDVVVLTGPGEYEAGGIKITGTSVGEKTVFSISMDGLELLLGDRDALEVAHQKLKEHNVLLVRSDTPGDAGFASALGVNATIFFGVHAKEVSNSVGKDTKVEMSKYNLLVGKFPAEVETVVLTSS